MCFTFDSKMRPCIYIVALAYAISFWTFEAVMENGFITENFAFTSLFPTEPGKLWFKIFLGVCIVGFAISYQERYGIIKDLERQLDALEGEGCESERSRVRLCSSCRKKEQHKTIHDHGNVTAHGDSADVDCRGIRV